MSWFSKRTNNGKKVDNITIFLRNGKRLLEKLITSCNGKCNPIRNFSAEELKMATNNYDKQKAIAHDYCVLYKGFLQNRAICVMKFQGDCRNNEDHPCCFNNIVFASQISHKNVLRLVGWCLETKIPTLVYESVEYGTLADRLHNPDQPFREPLIWRCRLMIAMEIANAVSYLHFGFARPIVFRDIKPSRVLLDEHNVTKLFDFSLAASIPEDKTHLEDGVMGTFGYIAPEYMTTGDCNEKCDVFSFGMLLLELLTGRTILSLVRIANDECGCMLLDYLKNIENRFYDIIDPIIVGDGSCPEKEQELQAFVELISKCVDESPEDRPTMVDVAKQLRKMYQSVV